MVELFIPKERGLSDEVTREGIQKKNPTCGALRLLANALKTSNAIVRTGQRHGLDDP